MESPLQGRLRGQCLFLHALRPIHYGVRAHVAARAVCGAAGSETVRRGAGVDRAVGHAGGRRGQGGGGAAGHAGRVPRGEHHLPHSLSFRTGCHRGVETRSAGRRRPAAAAVRAAAARAAQLAQGTRLALPQHRLLEAVVATRAHSLLLSRDRELRRPRQHPLSAHDRPGGRLEARLRGAHRSHPGQLSVLAACKEGERERGTHLVDSLTSSLAIYDSARCAISSRSFVFASPRSAGCAPRAAVCGSARVARFRFRWKGTPAFSTPPPVRIRPC
eukprot:ctg_93.g19